ncbi:hypothetical protein [Devosia sp. A369]
MNWPAQHSGCGGAVAYADFGTLRCRLLAGMAGTALLASVPGASAEGLVFTWSGGDTSPGYARPPNWDPIVLDADGNVVETTATLPSEGDWAIVTSGTPTMSNRGWSALGLDLSGGLFTIRSSKQNFSDYTVDMLKLSGTGQLSIGRDEQFGPSAFFTRDTTITGGAASGFGILNATNSISQSGGDVSQLTINTPHYTQSGGTPERRRDHRCLRTDQRRSAVDRRDHRRLGGLHAPARQRDSDCRRRAHGYRQADQVRQRRRGVDERQ